MNGRQRQEARQAGRGGAAIHPRQFESRKRQRQVLRPGDEAALFRLHEDGADTGAVERLHHLLFGRRPFVGVALARRDQARHGAARHSARRLHQHLEIEPIGKSPLNLAYERRWAR